jgi:hypothetical protein
VNVRKPLLSLAALAAALRLVAAVQIDANQYLEDIKYLASDQLKGREDGTPELDKAGEYIAKQFRSFGLRPAGDGGRYLQPFQVTTSTRPGQANRFVYSEGPHQASLKFDTEFRPLSLSANGNAAGQVVFAGYGITAPEYGYDDYSGLDVRNKLVLILRHEPQEFDEKSIFAGRIYTNHAQVESKAVNARAHGASAVVFVSDSPTHHSESDDIEKLGRAVGPGDAGIPFVQVKTQVADEWLRLAGHSLEEVVKGIDTDLRPRSFALPASLRLDISVDLLRKSHAVSNVVGYLPGASDEYVIVGAHYDHVGLGNQYSMEPSKKGTVHPGADDNASGTAGVIELARWFAKQPKHRRGILFIAFAGEEFGLLGSNHFVEAPALPLEKAVTMINLDMIGRLREGKLYMGGVGNASMFKPLIDALNRDAKFDIDDADADGYGSSDQYSFTPRQIPTLFFFTGMHPDYHRPSDTWDKIDAPAAAQLVDFVGDVTERLLDAVVRPQFVKRLRQGP